MSCAPLAARRDDDEAAQAVFAESWGMLRAIGEKEPAARCLELAGEFAMEQAVPLWGTAATLRAGIVARMPPVYRAHYVAAVALAREKLGDKTFQSLWAQGHQTPWALIELEGHTRPSACQGKPISTICQKDCYNIRLLRSPRSKDEKTFQVFERIGQTGLSSEVILVVPQQAHGLSSYASFPLTSTQAS